MILDNKKLFLLCVLGVSVHANASPLTQQTADQFYKYSDLDSLIKLKETQPNQYQAYAQSRVNEKLQNRVVPEQSRKQAVDQIADVYKDFVESRTTQIQNDAVEYYKSTFTQHQTEESVANQLQFYRSVQGKGVYQKQNLRRAKIQNLHKVIPTALSNQLELQESFKLTLGAVN